MWRYVANCVRTFQRGGASYAESRCGVSAYKEGSQLSSSTKAPGEESRQQADRKGQDWKRCHAVESWINAFTWSGAVLLGWYGSQLACLRRRRFGGEDFERTPGKFHSTFGPRFALAHPTERPSFRTGENVDAQAAFSPFNFESPEPRSGFPPFNVSNDLHTPASDPDSEFKDALRSIENKCGIVAVENGKESEGAAMIISSARKNYTPAIFNLAVCYEKGLGVKRDEKMALKLYRIAAARNHPGALYNLAVFYGQGRGGLARDLDAAEDLMRVAAAGGQAEAIAALKLFAENEQKNLPPPPVELEIESLTNMAFLHSIGRKETVPLVEPILLY